MSNLHTAAAIANEECSVVSGLLTTLSGILHDAAEAGLSPTVKIHLDARAVISDKDGQEELFLVQCERFAVHGGWSRWTIDLGNISEKYMVADGDDEPVKRCQDLIRSLSESAAERTYSPPAWRDEYDDGDARRAVLAESYNCGLVLNLLSALWEWGSHAPIQVRSRPVDHGLVIHGRIVNLILPGKVATIFVSGRGEEAGYGYDGNLYHSASEVAKLALRNLGVTPQKRP